MYSEFGLIQAIVSGNVMHGHFYEGGKAGDCNTGTIRLQLAADGNSFSGYYTCDDSSTQYEYSETLIGGPNTVDDVKCGLLASSGDVSGHWVNERFNFDICESNGKYQGSYTYEGSNGQTIPGYDSGVTYKGGLIGCGVYLEPAERGVSVVFKMADGRMGNIYTQSLDGEPYGGAIDNAIHGYSKFTVSNTNTGSCTASSGVVFNGEYDDYGSSIVLGNDGDDDDDSSSSMLTLSVLFFILIIAALI